MDLKILATADEQALQEVQPWPKSMEELVGVIETLLSREHDYNTGAHALRIGCHAVFNFLASALGCTGFQAGHAALDFLRQQRGYEHIEVRTADELLYPQYLDHIDGAHEMIEKHKDWLADRARGKLAAGDPDHVAPRVWKHWQWLASLKPQTPPPPDATEDGTRCS